MRWWRTRAMAGGTVRRDSLTMRSACAREVPTSLSLLSLDSASLLALLSSIAPEAAPAMEREAADGMPKVNRLAFELAFGK